MMISLEWMPPLMFGGLVVFMIIGYPVAFSLAAVGFFLVALQGISEIIKRVAFLNGVPVESLEAHYERPTQ